MMSGSACWMIAENRLVRDWRCGRKDDELRTDKDLEETFLGPRNLDFVLTFPCLCLKARREALHKRTDDGLYVVGATSHWGEIHEIGCGLICQN